MHVAATGIGPPLLLLHGAGVAGWMWQPVLDALGGDVGAIVPDLPGHGHNAATPYRSHLSTVAGLSGLLEARCPDGAVVAGFSLGGQLAVLLAATRPDLVRGVAVLSAQTVPVPLERLTLALVAASAPLAARPGFARRQAAQLGVPDSLRDAYVRDSAQVHPDTLVTTVAENLRFRLPPGWPTYPGRAVVAVGGRERRVMRDSALATVAGLAGSSLLIASECGHDLPWRRPDVVAGILRALCHPVR
ncbi:MAG: alpha/beta hydrolase [Propionicimonas sp.]|nr:alpha/beta hydrolase [Propionicimonas sp.]